MRKSQSFAVFVAAMLAFSVPAGATDPGRKACFADAKRLCPAQVKAFNRKAAEACMIQRINETSPVCHAAMLTIKDQRLSKRRAKGQ